MNEGKDSLQRLIADNVILPACLRVAATALMILPA